MNTVKITEENVGDYILFLDDDSSQNIGRTYFRGLAIHENDAEPPKALVVWEYRNIHKEADNEAAISRFYFEEPKYAKEILDVLSKEADSFDTKRIVCNLFKTDEKTKVILEDNGFSFEEKEDQNIEVTIAELVSLSFLTKKEIPDNVSDISELTVSQFRDGIQNCIANGRRGILEDLEYLPMEWFDEDLSSCVLVDGKVMGFFLVHKAYSGKLKVDLLYATGTDAVIYLIDMARLSLRYALMKYPEDTITVLPRHNRLSADLIDRLFADKKGETIFVGVKSA
ncbi:MAG: hypothetical protein K6C41_07820 [Lachnospiraceae bacterium]|nr:hypothetical protein [Lachnospiraceae bacterium]